MEKRPDLALSILDTLDRSGLCSRKLLARHSLLYSQALEKNDILLETDSVIAPAVKYYKRHGSPDERLLMLYYLGCIRWNSGNLVCRQGEGLSGCRTAVFGDEVDILRSL